MRYFSSVFSFFNEQPYQLGPLTQKLRSFQVCKFRSKPKQPRNQHNFFPSQKFQERMVQTMGASDYKYTYFSSTIQDIVVKITNIFSVNLHCYQ
jgi:hypothetical protein